LKKNFRALEGSIICKKGRADDPKQRQPKIDRAKKILKCEANVELKKGRQRTNPGLPKRSVHDGR
jgi:hypothetical protein